SKMTNAPTSAVPTRITRQGVLASARRRREKKMLRSAPSATKMPLCSVKPARARQAHTANPVLVRLVWNQRLSENATHTTHTASHPGNEIPEKSPYPIQVASAATTAFPQGVELGESAL